MSGATLPLELKAAIIEEIMENKALLLTCRLISKDFNDIATPHAFRTLNISRQRGFYTSFKALPAVTPIFAHVKEVNFRALETKDIKFEGDTIEESASMFTSIAKCLNLHTLRFYFPSIFEEEAVDDSDDDDGLAPMSSTRALQTAIFKTLACLDQNVEIPIHTLEVHGLLALPNEDIPKLRLSAKPLRNLRISVVTNDRDDFEMLYDEDYSHFWKSDMLSLLSCTENLTSLTLINDISTPAFALAANMEWYKLVLPRLESLILRKFVLTNEACYHTQDRAAGTIIDSVENFIIRHKKTLTHLDLSTCSVEIGSRDTVNQPRLWADIWINFRKELKKLRSFKFEPLPGRRNRQLEGELEDGDNDDYSYYSGYVWFFIESGYISSFEEAPSDQDADKRAFEALQLAISSTNQN